MGIASDLLASIPAYTGLSPVSFFTVLALAAAVYYLLSGFFVSASKGADAVPVAPLHAPVQVGDVAEEELLAFDGKDPEKPLLMAIKGQVYDVSQSRMFYGPGGPYAAFAGKDASRALAKMSFEEEDLTGNTEGLSSYELDALQDWEWKFMSKYIKVGQIVSKSRDFPEADASEVSNEVASEERGESNEVASEERGESNEVASEEVPNEVASEEKGESNEVASEEKGETNKEESNGNINESKEQLEVQE